MKRQAEVDQIDARLFVTAFSQTLDGLLIAGPAVVLPATITDAGLGQHVRAGLAAFRTGIRRPTREEMSATERELIRARGFRSRRAYEELLAVAGIGQDGEALTVYPFRRLEGGRGSVAELHVTLTNPSYDALGRAVRIALAESRPGAGEGTPT